MPTLKRQCTIPEARSTLQQLMLFHPVASLCDQLASLCAENAAEVEPMDAGQAAKWDTACGKLAVAANQLLV